jgi:hypothetical protein
MITRGDCLEVMEKIDSESIDSLVTDPPAGIAFMNKEWDKNRGGRNSWIEWMTVIMHECLRVLKPGSHGLVWALPRTSHWTATALEDAGFEIRDSVVHIFGSGFPKSHDPSKKDDRISKGLGSALKPAHENWILIRKSLSEKTLAANVLKHGCGALNIDDSRIETQDRIGILKQQDIRNNGLLAKKGKLDGLFYEQSPLGRFPANILLSHHENCEDECHPECAVKGLDDHMGILKSGSGQKSTRRNNGVYGSGLKPEDKDFQASIGGASRFFYCAKSSKSDKGAENSHPTVKSTKLMEYLIKLITPPNGIVLDPFMGSGSTCVAAQTLGFEFIGIEQEQEYVEIAKKRLNL